MADSAQTVIANWRASLGNKATELRAKYSQPQTYGTLFADADAMWKVATQFAQTAQNLHDIDDDQKQTASYNAVDLLELRGLARVSPQDQFITPEVRDMAQTRLTAPFDWLISVGGPVLQNQAAINEVARAVKDAPGNALHWTFKQIFMALGLPTWTGTAIAVVAIGGLAYWSYKSFLEPVGRSSRRILT